MKIKNNIKVFTYWETNKYNEYIPPYILCGLVSMKRAFGSQFILLSKHNLEREVDFDFSQKDFFFAGLSDPVKNETSRIVAKSDFLRFKYIQDHGGVWLDSDTVILKNFFCDINDLFLSGKLVWHSEQFFGSLPKNEIISKSVNTMLNEKRQIYGNPGRCKELIQENKKQVSFIPQFVWDPTGKLEYNASNWDIAANVDIKVEDFLKNDRCSLVKIYNSELSKMGLSNKTVAEFLDGNTLIAQLFKKINPDIGYWVTETDSLQGSLI